MDTDGSGIKIFFSDECAGSKLEIFKPDGQSYPVTLLTEEQGLKLAFQPLWVDSRH